MRLGIIRSLCGSFRSALSPVNAIHAAGPAFSHGQFLFRRTQPSKLRGPEEQSRSLSAMQLQMEIGSSQSWLSEWKVALAGIRLGSRCAGAERATLSSGVQRMNVMIHATESELQSFHVALLPEQALLQPITIQCRHEVRVF